MDAFLGLGMQILYRPHPLQDSLRDTHCHFSLPIGSLKPVTCQSHWRRDRNSEGMRSTLRPVPQHHWIWDLRPCGSPHTVGVCLCVSGEEGLG